MRTILKTEGRRRQQRHPQPTPPPIMPNEPINKILSSSSRLIQMSLLFIVQRQMSLISCILSVCNFCIYIIHFIIPLSFQICKQVCTYIRLLLSLFLSRYVSRYVPIYAVYFPSFSLFVQVHWVCTYMSFLLSLFPSIYLGMYLHILFIIPLYLYICRQVRYVPIYPFYYPSFSMYVGMLGTYKSLLFSLFMNGLYISCYCSPFLSVNGKYIFLFTPFSMLYLCRQVFDSYSMASSLY